MHEDPRDVIARAPMGAVQIAIILVCTCLNALDGFDILSISFASPGIAAEWGVDKATLGFVLSMELIGMSVGSATLGALADRWGRRPIILGCLLVMASGMAFAPLSQGVTSLSVCRFYTGLGIGGMLACTSAMIAECASLRTRSLAIALVTAGYPMGAVGGGAIVTHLLINGNWRSVFLLGAIFSAALLPVAWFLLPETVYFLIQRRGTDALKRVNGVMSRLGHPSAQHLPAPSLDQSTGSFAELFSPHLIKTSLFLTLAYFCHMMTFYFLLKWIPKIVVDMGYHASSAGGVLVWTNVGSLVGALVLAILSTKIAPRKLVVTAMIGSALIVVIFGSGQSSLAGLSAIAMTAGIVVNAGIVGMYAIVAQSFPTSSRGAGTGFVLGLGRSGGAAGVIIAGILFARGFNLQLVAGIMSTGSLAAAFFMLFHHRSQNAAGIQPTG